MTQRAAIYVRVNKSNQVESRSSLSRQIESCTTVALESGFNVVGIYQDAISGRVPMVDRPAGLELYLAIEARLIDVVIIYRMDRLSRDVFDFLTTVRDWSQAGIEIYALEIGQITNEWAANVKTIFK